MTATQSYMELMVSAGIGIVISALIITVGNAKSGKTSKDVTEDTKENDHISNDDDDKSIVINEDKFVEKTKKLQKLLGLSEEQVHEVLKETNKNLKNSKQGSVPEDEISWFSMLDTLVFLVFIGCLFYSINLLSHGDFGRVLLGLFPKEFESLNLTKFIQNYHILHK